jgi:23S rRNA (uracil1939-C5)-methyltransferase
MTLKAFDIELSQHTYGGECLGRLPDGRAVFVSFTLPGERVRARLVEDRKGFARAELIEVQRPSRERVKPRCPHFATCGGCHYQHMDYPAQLRAKETVLRDQLVRIAGIAEPVLRPAVPSPSPWNYRNTVQFHLSPAGKLGFQAAGGAQVVEIRECHLPDPALNDLWPLLNFEPGTLDRVAIRLGADGEALMMLEAEQAPELSIEELPLSAVLFSEDEMMVLAGDDFTVQEVKGRPFRVSAGSFFQVNTPMAGLMVEQVLRLLDPGADDVVLDLYCGVGLFSAFFAPHVREVIGVELSLPACADFAVNLDEFDNISLYEGAVEQVLPELKLSPTLAVVDPPRAGLEKPALDALVVLRPRKIAYVSCDPATLARDAKRLLEAGYILEESTPFDLFPQTYHIESISLFSHTRPDA